MAVGVAIVPLMINRQNLNTSPQPSITFIDLLMPWTRRNFREDLSTSPWSVYGPAHPFWALERGAAKVHQENENDEKHLHEGIVLVTSTSTAIFTWVE